jgi:predicted nucleic acid-binding protein
MKNLVVDSSISVKWFIEEEDSDIAQLILDQYTDGTLLHRRHSFISRTEFDSSRVW